MKASEARAQLRQRTLRLNQLVEDEKAAEENLIRHHKAIEGITQWLESVPGERERLLREKAFYEKQSAELATEEKTSRKIRQTKDKIRFLQSQLTAIQAGRS